MKRFLKRPFTVVVISFTLALVAICVLIPAPSSPFFNPHRFKAIFYSNDSIKEILLEHAYAGMTRAEFDNMVLGAGGVVTRTGDSAERKRSSVSVLDPYRQSLTEMEPKYYVDYNLKSIAIMPDLAPSRILTAHFDEKDQLEVLRFSTYLLIPNDNGEK